MLLILFPHLFLVPPRRSSVVDPDPVGSEPFWLDPDPINCPVPDTDPTIESHKNKTEI